jgi:hypothetical protein
MTDKPYSEMTFEEWCATKPPEEDDEPKPKVLAIEVPERTFETAKAKPNKIRILTEDEFGNRVIGAALIRRERAAPEQPVSVDNGGRAAQGEMKWGKQPWQGGGIPNRSWDGGRGGGDELVSRNYDIFACLKGDD